MQSENDPTPSDLPPTASTEDTDSASRVSKRGRQSSQSPHESLTAPEFSNAPGSARSRKTLKQPPTIRGSSRDTNEMHRSSPEASGSIKYTRTGRVSKATKGQRVHHCEECGKTYTRAEHLRRHQQNHKPGAFPCDFPGCSRSFYREDLLIRHRARHNDPHHPPSRRHSFGSQSSAPDTGLPPSASGSTPGFSQPPTAELPSIIAPEMQQEISASDAQTSHDPSRAPPKRPVAPNELDPGLLPLSVDGCGPTFRSSWNPSSSLSSPLYNHEYGGYESPDETLGPPYYHNFTARTRHTSDASHFAYQPATARTSRSPVSAGSSTFYNSHWSFLAGCDATYPNIPSAYPSAYITRGYQNNSTLPYGAQGILTAESRDYMEEDQLNVLGHHASAVDDSLDQPGAIAYSRYVDAYFAGVHELYPVLHKPSYEHATANPLLRAAVLALGGQAVGDRADLSNARTLHEKCLKVLKKRNLHTTNTYRVCDMQAVFLVEVYSIFKSRRPQLQFSENFEQIYRYLSVAMTPTPSLSSMQGGNFDEHSIDDITQMDTLCKQRLLLACYALEQQHNLLFGRTSAIGIAGISSALPFPASQVRWDAEFDFDAGSSSDTHYEKLSDALKVVPYMTNVSRQPHDAFQSMLMLASVCDTSNDVLDWDDCREDYSLLLATEPSARMRLSFHTFGLCKNTTMRQLLAVAGESWVMAEKLTTRAEYLSAQVELRAWFRNTDSVNSAMRHALSILEIHQETSRTGLLYQEWAVYLAAVVIWAYAYMLRNENGHPRLAIPSPTEPRPSPTELEQSITTLISHGSTGVRGWTQARDVLIWVKMGIERVYVPHTCGLVSGALDVLSKLVTRGDENDWF